MAQLPGKTLAPSRDTEQPNTWQRFQPAIRNKYQMPDKNK